MIYILFRVSMMVIIGVISRELNLQLILRRKPRGKWQAGSKVNLTSPNPHGSKI
jgi:hypothetical protein